MVFPKLSSVVMFNAEVSITLNCAEPVNDPSVALTVCFPTVADDGTVNVALEKSPDEPLVIVLGVVLTFVPSNDIVIAEFAAKPLPETLTVAPATPDDGLSNTAGGLTVNVDVPELPWCVESEGEYVPVIVTGNEGATAFAVYIIVQAPVESSVHEGELNEPPELESSNVTVPAGVVGEPD